MALSSYSKEYFNKLDLRDTMGTETPVRSHERRMRSPRKAGEGGAAFPIERLDEFIQAFNLRGGVIAPTA
jgi:hypothetical protein